MIKNCRFINMSKKMLYLFFKMAYKVFFIGKNIKFALRTTGILPYHLGFIMTGLNNIVIGVSGRAPADRLQKAWYHCEQLGRARDQTGYVVYKLGWIIY